jgi:hypothetical protein
VKHFLIPLAALLMLAGCTDEHTALRVLNSAGFKDVQLTGYRWYGCGSEDNFRTGFNATAPSGERVSGVVCSGWMQGATYNFD